MTRNLRIVVIGLTITSSWGNGHATTYRALLRALAKRGHSIDFLECDKPWYAASRDLTAPDFCTVTLYQSARDLQAYRTQIERADLVIVGSYVPDGIAVARLVRPWCRLLAFYDIDTPVTLAKLADGTCDYLNAAIIPDYDLYLSFTGGPMLEMLASVYGARNPVALFCAADPDLYQPAAPGPPPYWDLGYLGTYSADRQPTLQNLLIEPARQAPHKRFVVAGPQYPDTIAWPDNVERIDHLPPSSHADFYTSCAWALNVTRADMVRAGYSPSVRLFEAAACGTPVISDRWDGLEKLFRIGFEIEVASTAFDVLEIISRPSAAGAAIGAAARNAVLASHTADHRAQALERFIRQAELTHAGVASASF